MHPWTPRTKLYDGAQIRFDNPEVAHAFWTTKRQFFEDHGYLLHTTQSPTPGPQETSSTQESSHDVSSRVDATRKSDGQRVCIKRVGTFSIELLLLECLHGGAGKHDPGNHCVPVLDVIRDDERENVSYTVMPALQPVSSATFKTVGDVVDFTSQVLLGLNFLHSRTIAHRDCSMHNVMFGLYEYPTSRPQRKGTFTFNISFRDRRITFRRAERPQAQFANTSSRVRYYFVGLGGLMDCPETVIECVRGHHSKDQEPPEYRLYQHNPFILDVFLVGNMLRREILDKYSNVEFLESLVRDMVREYPRERKDIKGSLRTWFNILPTVPSWQRRCTLRHRTRPRIEKSDGTFRSPLQSNILYPEFNHIM
ncbi:hypothetical protein BDY19DRAFT_1057302 [Irpex rosettiformis]|uniref:Uncharacterized protein n=1 Tax=Irpex rosettiformis TaxID=378272 RepID=A0ACB8U3E2_9APHY|nr:hypothetical protein BDY19DRAFT_1057302 [Irpex rosettiformis]